ncbi:MAG: porin [Pseudomonadota bacterium]
MKKILLPLSALALLGGVPTAWADGLVSADAELSFNRASGDGDDLDATFLGADAFYETGAWDIFGGVSFLWLDDDSDDFRADFASLAFAYGFNQVNLGAEVAYFGSDDSDDDLTFYSIFGEYVADAFVGGLAYTDSDDDDFGDEVYTIFATYDVTSTDIIGAAYYSADESDVFTAFADFERELFEIAGDLLTDDDITLLSVGGSYDVGGGFGVLAGLSYGDFDGDDVTSFSIGGEYEILPLTDIFLTVGRVEADGDDADVFSVGINYDLGKRRSGYQSVSGAAEGQLGTLFGFF